MREIAKSQSTRVPETEPAMTRQADKTKRSSAGPSLLLPGAVLTLALPSAVLAFSSDLNRIQQDSLGAIETIVPGKLDPRLARSISVRALAKGEMFRFTPAAQPANPGRQVTVAVLSSGVTRSILVRAPSPGPVAAPAPSTLRIAPMAYNLGVAREYQGFAPGTARRGIDVRQIDMPDLANFDAGSRGQGNPSRFNPRIELDERASAGRAPRTFEGDGEQTVDVGGSYRVGRNIDVTAGVRLSQERNRLRPVEQTQGRQDGQSVYVGTQFRF